MRGVTHCVRVDVQGLCISIHTPHAGSDEDPFDGIFFIWRFQSTLPMRGVTIFALKANYGYTISIHTPHAGSDTNI